ncbi:MAG: hypothetical protein GC171_13590 [Terrimonas sp.]|nr:hypothetical protein [Terrimonas sp.]
MLLFTEQISPRLQYIAEFISQAYFGIPVRITTDISEYISADQLSVNYSNQQLKDEEFWVQPHSLLFEKGIGRQQVDCFDFAGQKAFFRTGGDFPFDIFASTFYLLSRYEEYLPHTKDIYGRFAHKNALAFKEGFLQIPLVNIWMEEFKNALRSSGLSWVDSPKTFRFIPTYDIDIAFAYQGKGFMKTAGGLFRSFLKADFPSFSERLRVVGRGVRDPYDSFDWMDALHDQFDLQPLYFFLVPEKKGKYDKNILPSNPRMRSLVRKIADKYAVGIHPSWKSGDDENLLKEEIDRLREMTGRDIDSCRFHYVRFNLPGSYRQLIREGIRNDHSMGYGSINGFRASVADPFYWYDLEKEEQTGLLVFPFCFMEANSYYEQQYSVPETGAEILHYGKKVKSLNGMLITLWHNQFLGSSKEFSGLKEVYEGFIRSMLT